MIKIPYNFKFNVNSRNPAENYYFEIINKYNSKDQALIFLTKFKSEKNLISHSK